jgi:peptide/nickel transport system substrate-binding protein
MRRNLLIGAPAAAAALTAFAVPATARTLRSASQGDIPTFDGLYALRSLIRTVDPKGGADGNVNLGKYSNPKADALIDKVKTEIDDRKRNEMMREVLQIHAADVGHLPLHQQVIPWAMRSNVSVHHRADNRLDTRWVKID